MHDEDLEEFKKWVDSHKEPNGSIDLSKHPDLVDYINHTYGNVKMDIIGFKENIGDAISYDLSTVLK